MESSLIGLIYSILTEDKNNIQYLDDIFEENGLNRVKDSFEIYWTYFHEEDFDVNLDLNSLIEDIERGDVECFQYPFSSLEAREAFKRGLEEFTYPSTNIILVVGYSFEDFIKEARNFVLQFQEKLL